jgi:hypothetical protein
MSIRFTTTDGVQVEADLRLGFTVHNQDGSAYRRVHIENARVIGNPPTPPSGGGEPMPVAC